MTEQDAIPHTPCRDAEPSVRGGSQPLAASGVTSLTLDFLRWVASTPRTYAETMDAWRTSCPRYSIWEDALADDLIRVEDGRGGGMGQSRVTLSLHGRAVLQEYWTP